MLTAILMLACTSQKLETGEPVDTSPVDHDGDGFTSADGDCDDGDATIYPGATEVTDDGIDQDCLDGDIRTDSDSDGFNVDEDCNDQDATVYPGATEVCDGVDQNCSGVADEGTTLLGYEDADNDGFGSDASIVEYCDAPPEGYVAVDGDCDKENAEVYPGAPEYCNLKDDDCDGVVDNEAIPTNWYLDADQDGVGDSSTATLTCTPDAGWVLLGGDCNDNDATISPLLPELCDDVDRNCDGDPTANPVDGTTYYADSDGDGFGDPNTPVQYCETPTSGAVAGSDDCDDSSVLVNPEASELCDGLDNNCDGSIDNDVIDLPTWYYDADLDGYGDPSVTLVECAQPVGYVAPGATGDDCNDADASINPGASEVCDSIDNDCDGVLDEQDDSNVDEIRWYLDADGDGYGEDETELRSCVPVGGRISVGGDCDGDDAAINPGAIEICDGLDNNCDGAMDGADALDAKVWYADRDGDGYGDAGNSAVACDAPTGHISDSLDCNDGDFDVNPGVSELCGLVGGNGVDENCDGLIDDSSASDVQTWYLDVDTDGYGDDTTGVVTCSPGNNYVLSGGDCDDGEVVINPRATELCDGVDNDCDGGTDEAGSVGELAWYEDGDGDGQGNAGVMVVACDAPVGFVASLEDCDDGDGSVYVGAVEASDEVDDDCDGWIDEDFIAYGDLIVHEVARQTAFGTGSVVAEGQWFEVRNVSSHNVYMDNFTIVRENGASSDQFSVDPSWGVVLVPGDVVVFCNTDDYEYPGDPASDLLCDYIWSDESQSGTASGTYFDNTFNLQVDEDVLGIYIEGDANTGRLVDEVAWYFDANNGLWPQLQGFSILLDPDHINAVDNDLISYWCVSPTSPSASYLWYNSSVVFEYGTPGSTGTKECYAGD